MKGPAKHFAKRPPKIVEMGGVAFKLIALHSRYHWLNLEPSFGYAWRIIAFRERPGFDGCGKVRLQWTSRGTWVDADDKDADALFEWGEELDTQVRLALASKQMDRRMKGIRAAGGLRPA